jgi:hypothetical protein
MDDRDRMTVPFSVKIVLRDNGPGVWQTARVDIFDSNDTVSAGLRARFLLTSGLMAELHG